MNLIGAFPKLTAEERDWLVANAETLNYNSGDTIIAEGPETIGAFIGEPVMGAGGVMVPPEGYWPGVAEICAKYDILLVAVSELTGASDMDALCDGLAEVLA